MAFSHRRCPGTGAAVAGRLDPSRRPDQRRPASAPVCVPGTANSDNAPDPRLRGHPPGDGQERRNAESAVERVQRALSAGERYLAHVHAVLQLLPEVRDCQQGDHASGPEDRGADGGGLCRPDGLPRRSRHRRTRHRLRFRRRAVTKPVHLRISARASYPDRRGKKQSHRVDRWLCH